MRFLFVVIKRWEIEMRSQDGKSISHRFDATDIVNITDIKVDAFENIEKGKT